MESQEFVNSMIPCLFKLLPMREEFDLGLNNGLYEYIENLIEDITGSQYTFPDLCKDIRYISVINLLHYISQRDLSFQKYRGAILRAVNLMDKIGGNKNA